MIYSPTRSFNKLFYFNSIDQQYNPASQQYSIQSTNLNTSHHASPHPLRRSSLRPAHHHNRLVISRLIPPKPDRANQIRSRTHRAPRNLRARCRRHATRRLLTRQLCPPRRVRALLCFCVSCSHPRLAGYEIQQDSYVCPPPPRTTPLALCIHATSKWLALTRADAVFGTYVADDSDEMGAKVPYIMLEEPESP